MFLATVADGQLMAPEDSREYKKNRLTGIFRFPGGRLRCLHTNPLEYNLVRQIGSTAAIGCESRCPLPTAYEGEGAGKGSNGKLPYVRRSAAIEHSNFFFFTRGLTLTSWQLSVELLFP